ncbi:hypothetical protein D8674_003364 [Pyrus ussuriensis x Pyrus communis]|uniref:Uncharacterized protein n=1 Tax=Pyrus ussuriensis x Pyrus communis TaxID=2448454 RepID=A0A5N5FGW0_9ROSA|nr:hypothetical protein D8674_003364 [Pyrus ussuriensis x Pyrus communis]
MSGGDYRLQPRYVQAADLVSRLAEFAFRRLSASDQLKQIDEVVSKPAELNVESDEDLRVKTFTKLFSEQLRNFPLLQGDWIPEASQYYVTFEILEKFSEKEEFFLFKQLGSNDQQELVQKMVDRIKELGEEDFILRRFTELYAARYLWYHFGKEEAAKYLLNSGKEITQFPHAEIWVGVSTIWFETLSAYEQGEHIAVLTRKLLGDEAKGKLPGESEADFRVRRFKELFEKLEPDSQQYLLEHIRTTLRDDLGLPRPLSADFFDGRSLFDNESFKFVNPNPRVDGGVGPRGATSSVQRQGTSSSTTSSTTTTRSNVR